MSRLIALGLLAACNGDKDDGTIIPLDDTDADADADSDSDADTDADTDSDTDTDVEPALCATIAPPGDAIPVAPTDDLSAEIASAPAGATLSLADGTYAVTGPIRIDKALTLVSQSGQRGAVTIDGGRAGGSNLLEIAASDVTIAHLTLTASYNDLVAIQPVGSDITGTVLHDVRFLDPGRIAIAVTPDATDHYVDDGELSCSSIELTAPGRIEIRDSCTTGGIHAEGARGWVVRDNTVSGFWCDIGSSGPAIRFTRGSRDTEITRNTLTDVVFGIVVGETQDQIGRVYEDAPCGPTVLQHIDGRVTNNIVSASVSGIAESLEGVTTGIRAESSCNVRVIHNSVYSVIAPGSSIEHTFETTTGVFANNLMSHTIRRQQDSTAEDVQNLENQPFDSWFYPAESDFHTAPGATWAIDQGSPDYVDEVGVDIDNAPRDDGLPDVGADEK